MINILFLSTIILEDFKLELKIYFYNLKIIDKAS